MFKYGFHNFIYTISISLIIENKRNEEKKSKMYAKDYLIKRNIECLKSSSNILPSILDIKDIVRIMITGDS